MDMTIEEQINRLTTIIKPPRTYVCRTILYVSSASRRCVSTSCFGNLAKAVFWTAIKIPTGIVQRQPHFPAQCSSSSYSSGSQLADADPAKYIQNTLANLIKLPVAC